MKTDLKGLDARETEQWAADLGLDAYRGRQIRQWLFKRLSASWDEMTNLPKSLRSALRDQALLTPLSLKEILTSEDGTRKLLFGTLDGLLIESVLIPERDHFTLCISSQAGCAMGCRFCLTAKQGFKRNLSASEIVEQVIQCRRGLDAPDRLTNIVFMGMGEPLANYHAVVKAIGNLTGDDGLNFSHRRVTLSTCGLVPEIKRLGEEVTVNMAVSLNAADDKTRSLLMPVNRKYPLNPLLRACREFPLPNRRMITFEYILIDGVNDRDRDAETLCGRLSGLRAKINLIRFNPHAGTEFKPSSPERVLRFQEILIGRHFTAIIRKSKGRDIMAACGQLSGARGKD
ncbi:MAG: 23S rRNA (adenine(2503)-C(2))-methyltransferase RlmN [Deltaproteobacteria bacterium]|nr:23S rRNA (adenine(2503)-C(2))-methyltransferase RlmN [Deltaproteobacteria bacterium]MBW2284947.1 23S rRNA (adenine(2503)-C(2))-methyltransferase RlmN [Deltaproteobacteria bacterium]